MSHTLISIIAGVLILLTLAAALHLFLRRSQAEVLEVGSNVLPETAAPRGAWISVGVLAALAVVASLFAWGPLSHPGPPRPRIVTAPSAPAPQTPPAKTSARPPGPNLLAWLDWLRPHPGAPGERRRRKGERTPQATTTGKPGSGQSVEVAPREGVQPPVTAPNPDPGAVLADPVFIRRPSPEDLARFYPDGAPKGRTGVAVIACTVGAAGFLRNCNVVIENPPGQGFGPAALRVAYRFRVAPQSRTGQATAGRTVRVPVTFTAN